MLSQTLSNMNFSPHSSISLFLLIKATFSPQTWCTGQVAVQRPSDGLCSTWLLFFYYHRELVLVPWQLASWQLAKLATVSHPMKFTPSCTKRNTFETPGIWNICRLTQVSLIFIFSSAHQDCCFRCSWQLMWLMEPLLIGFVSPLCSRFRRSRCLP